MHEISYKDFDAKDKASLDKMEKIKTSLLVIKEIPTVNKGKEIISNQSFLKHTKIALEDKFGLFLFINENHEKLSLPEFIKLNSLSKNSFLFAFMFKNTFDVYWSVFDNKNNINRNINNIHYDELCIKEDIVKKIVLFIISEIREGRNGKKIKQ